MSENTAIVTGPADVGSRVNATPCDVRRANSAPNVGDFERGERDALREHRFLKRLAGWVGVGLDRELEVIGPSAVTVIQRYSPTGMSCFFVNPSTSV